MQSQSLPRRWTHPRLAANDLQSNRGHDEWQRRLGGKRITDIRTFIETGNNIIANTPMLFIRENTKAVNIVTDKKGDKFLKIVFANFLKRIPKAGYIDAIAGGGGLQANMAHRQAAQNLRHVEIKSGKDLEVLIIIFPAEFDIHEAAKIFAEINTLQEGLSSLHTLFMQHRFHIPHPNPKRRFSPKDWRSSDHPDSGNLPGRTT